MLIGSQFFELKLSYECNKCFAPVPRQYTLSGEFENNAKLFSVNHIRFGRVNHSMLTVFQLTQKRTCSTLNNTHRICVIEKKKLSIFVPLKLSTFSTKSKKKLKALKAFHKTHKGCDIHGV